MPKNNQMARIAIEQRNAIRRQYVRALEEPYSEKFSEGSTDPNAYTWHYAPAEVMIRGRRQPALHVTTTYGDGHTSETYYSVKTGQEVDLNSVNPERQG